MFEFFRNFWSAGKTKAKNTVQSSQSISHKRQGQNSISIVKTLLIFAALAAAALSPETVIATSITDAKDKPLPKPHSPCGSSNTGDETPCVAPKIKLPAGCKDYKVIKGNPATAKTLLLGENHDPCREVAKKCKNALIAQRLTKADPETTIAVLYESAAHNQHLSCKEMHADRVDNCRGWNGPRTDYPLETVDYIYNAADLIKKDLHPRLNAILNLPSHLQRAKTIEMLEKAKQNYEQERLTHEQSHAVLFKRFKTSHPEIDAKDFHSDAITFRNKRVYFIERIQGLLNKINAGATTLQILNELADEYNALFNIAEKYAADPNSVQIPNRYMLQAITANQNNDLVLLSAGHQHLDAKLFDNLDAVKISYAALNCTLT